ncbi:hypothetical protein N7466_001645 [Penicillium verhagenii]|uniref:uncharacterized protein n=1 Tax=Penicillium verhagenii TaxID=1562060 RepID=UPI002545309F|nr:uncharacterized protein N7466_001645 [Penicillium verhagenii]KAJ5938511.1 hypothetical protein N7466_001645 [Penicillium verhagenii]
MTPTTSNQSHVFHASKNSIRQKQGRRRICLMKKASEYSKICDADVCVGIRLHETGKVFILSADSTGFWEFVKSKLDSYYPVPKFVTEQDLEKTGSMAISPTEVETESGQVDNESFSQEAHE